MTESTTVGSSEKVARILSTEWFVDGQLMNVAFTLLEGETYISVNRPAISTYDSDVAGFVTKHGKYLFGTDNYKRAILSVSDIRDIKVDAFGEPLKINVEVEPRDSHTKSHAGIFTRYENKNVKRGDTLSLLEKEISADDVLIKVRTQLLNMTTVEQLTLYKSDESIVQE
jgi:hypothetical protein